MKIYIIIKPKINNFGKHERDFTYIDDAVEMVEKLLLKKI